MNFEVATFSGYLPCTLDDKPSGFEYFYEVINNSSQRHLQITFVTHSEFRDLLSASIAAAVLAEISDGILEDTEEGKSFKGIEAITWAKTVEIEANNELAKLPRQESSASSPEPPKPWWRFW